MTAMLKPEDYPSPKPQAESDQAAHQVELLTGKDIDHKMELPEELLSPEVAAALRQDLVDAKYTVEYADPYEKYAAEHWGKAHAHPLLKRRLMLSGSTWPRGLRSQMLIDAIDEIVKETDTKMMQGKGQDVRGFAGEVGKRAFLGRRARGTWRGLKESFSNFVEDEKADELKDESAFVGGRVP